MGFRAAFYSSTFYSSAFYSDYTQGFLSEFSGLSVSFISDLENGKKTAELEKAIYLANLLGLDLCLEGREHGS